MGTTDASAPDAGAPGRAKAAQAIPPERDPAGATARSDAPWRAALSRPELERFLEIDDRRAWGSVALNWALVFASFALVAYRPHTVTLALALLVIGARQLGLAVLMHEAAHHTLFRNRALNDWVGNWLCAYPVLSDLYGYRTYHLKHHANTWTKDDPDLGLALPFPISQESFARKVIRDLSGQSGIKFARARAANLRARWRRGDRSGRMATLGFVATQLVLLGLLALFKHPELYLLWLASWLTTHTLVTRIRSIAEHSMTTDPKDPLQNTRTTLASWWERLLVSPNRVNYHLEHHLLMTVPHYKLPELHRLLKERGILAEANVARGYLDVLSQAASATPQ